MEHYPSLFCPFFCLLYFFLPPFEDLGCFSGCLMSSAGIQKLFCGIYSAFKCSFDEFVGEKVFSPSYSSAILAPPPHTLNFKKNHLSTDSLYHFQALRYTNWTMKKEKNYFYLLKDFMGHKTWSHRSFFASMKFINVPGRLGLLLPRNCI